MIAPTKAALKRFLARAWRLARSPGSRVATDAVVAPVLCYHSVNPDPCDECDPLSPNDFDRHLEHLRGNYEVITLGSLANSLHNNEPLPPNAVVVTFDDGYADNYEHAFPILVRHRVPATIFLVTGFVGGEIELIPQQGWGPLSWGQVDEMSSSGLVTIGAHTHTHRPLGRLTNGAAREEVRRSKLILEERLGRRVPHFAYPNGQGRDMPRAAVDEVRKLGFDAACSTFWRTTHRSHELFRLNRVMIKGADTVEVLEQKLRGAYDYIYFLHKLDALRSRLVSRGTFWT